MKIYLVFFLFFISCNYQSSTENKVVDNELLFSTKCSICHGEDGRKRLNDAADLSLSKLDSNLFFQMINEGRRGMPSYENDLSEKEKQQLYVYFKKLKIN
jgi:mono/diheme cytochrome c family protein